MGLFDIFKKKDAADTPDRELTRLRKMVSNKLSQNADRHDAIERLVDMRTPAAAEVLLSRFTWNLDPSITDRDEKERALEGIALVGEAALEPIRNFCSRAESIVWPIKALRRIVDGERLENELLSLLDVFDTDYMRNPEPKVQLIQALEGFTSDDLRVAGEPFLSDISEQVRFAAVTTVFEAGSEKSVESLIEALAEDESLRVKNRIASGLVERAWAIPEGLRERAVEALPRGFSLQDGLVLGAPQS